VEYTDRTALRELVQSMVGRPAWSPALGIGSYLTLEVGARAGTHGEYHVWLYCTAWRLDRGAELLCGSEDDRGAITKAIAVMDGRTVAAAGVSDSLELTLGFDDGTVLRAFPIFSRGYEHWMVFAPNGYVYTAGPGSIWTAEPQGGHAPQPPPQPQEPPPQQPPQQRPPPQQPPPQQPPPWQPPPPHG
jgi:hypothetical protein